jgi:hypothetical protein
VFAVPLMELLGGSGHVAELAARYLRISAIGLPFALIALAGQGWLRGMSRLREPLVILVLANLANVVLELFLVYGLDLGLDGSALGTVLAQLGMGAAFAWLLLRAEHSGSRRPDWAGMHSVLTIGAAILIRTAALLASFIIAGAVCARISPAALGAHQIAYQLFVFLALVLDAIAIAGQVIVGRMLGAADGDGARAAARRMIGWSLVVGCGFGVALLALQNVIPELFTNDQAVIAQAEILWPLFALMQPTGAIVFALDGILIGAGRRPLPGGRDGVRDARVHPDRAGDVAVRLGHRRRVVGAQRADGRKARPTGPAVRLRALGGSGCRTSAKPPQGDRTLTKEPSRTHELAHTAPARRPLGADASGSPPPRRPAIWASRSAPSAAGPTWAICAATAPPVASAASPSSSSTRSSRRSSRSSRQY